MNYLIFRSVVYVAQELFLDSSSSGSNLVGSFLLDNSGTYSFAF